MNYIKQNTGFIVYHEYYLKNNTAVKYTYKMLGK